MPDAGPNLLVIQTDEQSAWTLGVYGGRLVETPNIDRLGREGAVFDNFFTNSAVCTPSRGCFLTGRYPEAHGAFANNEILRRDEITWAQVLADRDYETGYAGKWHLDGTPRPGWVHPDRSMGFRDNRFMFNRGHWKRIETWPPEGREPTAFPYEVIGDETSYTTDWLTDRAIEFLRRPRSAPFAYMLSLPDPHTPFTVREPYASLYTPDAMPLPSTLRPAWMPRWASDLRRRMTQGIEDEDLERVVRERMAAYCGMVKCIDDNVGRLLAALEEDGRLDDTVVVFTTDHGQYLGEHGLFGKNAMFETAYRIPLLIRWPRQIAPGTRIDRIVDTVDVQRTLLGLMGAEPCGREQGRDASPLLRGEACAWEDISFAHHCWQRAGERPHAAHHSLAGAFTPGWQLILDREGDHVLFDRAGDPAQTVNRYADPTCRTIVGDLTDRIVRHHAALQTPAHAWLATL
ncbi:MAG: sulfatase-like hydrolase/transferase [Planctomycetota bacterium]